MNTFVHLSHTRISGFLKLMRLISSFVLGKEIWSIMHVKYYLNMLIFIDDFRWGLPVSSGGLATQYNPAHHSVRPGRKDDRYRKEGIISQQLDLTFCRELWKTQTPFKVALMIKQHYFFPSFVPVQYNCFAVSQTSEALVWLCSKWGYRKKLLSKKGCFWQILFLNCFVCSYKKSLC